MSIANKSFLAFLRNFDVVLMVAELNNAWTRQAALESTGRNYAMHPDLLALQLVCKGAWDAMAWCRANKRYIHQKEMVEYILAGGDVTRDIPEFSQQHPLRFPYAQPPGFTQQWRTKFSEYVTTVDLSSLCGFQWCDVSSEDLPLADGGELFPSARSLTVGDSWGGFAKPLSAAVREITYRCLLSGGLQEVSLYFGLHDALLVLERLPVAAGLSLVSLRLSPPLGGEQGCSTEDRLAIAALIARFESLRDLTIPSALLHRDTLGAFASLPSLQTLELTSLPTTRGVWQDTMDIDRDDWSSMDGGIQGFGNLQHLYFDGTHPDQLCELVGVNALLGAVRTLSVRSGQPETVERGNKYDAAFRALGHECVSVRHLNLGVASLDEALLRELAQLDLLTINFIPMYPSLVEAALGIWPQVEVTAQGDYQTGFF